MGRSRRAGLLAIAGLSLALAVAITPRSVSVVSRTHGDTAERFERSVGLPRLTDRLDTGHPDIGRRQAVPTPRPRAALTLPTDGSVSSRRLDDDRVHAEAVCALLQEGRAGGVDAALESSGLGCLCRRDFVGLCFERTTPPAVRSRLVNAISSVGDEDCLVRFWSQAAEAGRDCREAVLASLGAGPTRNPSAGGVAAGQALNRLVSLVVVSGSAAERAALARVIANDVHLLDAASDPALDGLANALSDRQRDAFEMARREGRARRLR